MTYTNQIILAYKSKCELFLILQKNIKKKCFKIKKVVILNKRDNHEKNKYNNFFINSIFIYM